MNFDLTSGLVQLVAPIRAVAQRFAFLGLLALCIVLMILSKSHIGGLERARTATADVVAPILQLLARPVSGTEAAIQRVSDMVEVYQANQTLRHENAELLRWQDVARRLDTENQALRGLANFAPSETAWSISAQAIGSSGGAYSRSLLIDRGSDDGIANGQAALSGSGLVGRIVEVGQRTARVLLLTDINSRIPVAVGDRGERAILAGDNTERPLLVYLSPSVIVRPGDRLVSSGDGGVFPPDIDVGAVSEVGAQARVDLTTRLSTLEYLRIVDFGLGGVLPPSAVPLPKAPQHKPAEVATRP